MMEHLDKQVDSESIDKENDYKVESYLIHASGFDLTVVPMTDGAYRVLHGGRFVADLYPEITAAGVYWNGFGQLSVRLAGEIGSQIYAHEV